MPAAPAPALAVLPALAEVPARAVDPALAVWPAAACDADVPALLFGVVLTARLPAVLVVAAGLPAVAPACAAVEAFVLSLFPVPAWSVAEP